MSDKNDHDYVHTHDPLTADGTLVTWDEKYATGIELVDSQHKELISLTNKLYKACMDGYEAVSTVFKEAMSSMVEYVRYHFAAEEKIMDRIKYPMYSDHKKQHEVMVRLILESAMEYNEGKKTVPHNFVRILKDWILSHIAIYDKAFGTHVADLRKKQMINENDLVL